MASINSRRALATEFGQVSKEQKNSKYYYRF